MNIKFPYKITNTLCILSFLITASPARADLPAQKPARSINVSVDARVELICIIFRLAGNPEYNRSQFLSYVGDIQNYFGQFKNHPAVKLAKELRNSSGVSFDAPMSLAVHIKDINSCELLVPIDPFPALLDTRWKKDETIEFLSKAKQFVQDTKFNSFFAAHKKMYDNACSRFRAMMEKESHLEWFDQFFGDKQGAEFYIYLGMVNGPCSYGSRIKINEAEKYYCIPGVSKFSLLGLGEPSFDKSMIPTVIHEFCHSYANPIVDAHKTEIEESGKKIYALVEKQMVNNAYGYWLTVMRESLVRACVVRYLEINESPEAAKKEIQADINKSFLWMQEFSDLFIEYEQHRNKYPTLNDFFPKVIEFFDNYTKKSSPPLVADS